MRTEGRTREDTEKCHPQTKGSSSEETHQQPDLRLLRSEDLHLQNQGTGHVCPEPLTLWHLIRAAQQPKTEWSLIQQSKNKLLTQIRTGV